jgi:uncharacterized protein (DUF362 family)
MVFTFQKYFLMLIKLFKHAALKTHRFGGHFTMSLKNSIGIIAKRVPKGL